MLVSDLCEAQGGTKRVWGIKQDKSFQKHCRGCLLLAVQSRPFACVAQLQKHVHWKVLQRRAAIQLSTSYIAA